MYVIKRARPLRALRRTGSRGWVAESAFYSAALGNGLSVRRLFDLHHDRLKRQQDDNRRRNRSLRFG